MCTTAKVVDGYINIITVDGYADGLQCITVDIDPDDPYGSFKKLPAAIEYNGRVFGKSAYNSDSNRAYYRTDTAIARVVRKGN